MAAEAELYRGVEQIHRGPVGDELKRGARRLADALERVEAAVSAQRARPVPANPALAQKHERLLQEHARLKQENVRQARALKEAEANNASVSAQVESLSARLEAMIAHVGTLLEE